MLLLSSFKKKKNPAGITGREKNAGPYFVLDMYNPWAQSIENSSSLASDADAIRKGYI